MKWRIVLGVVSIGCLLGGLAAADEVATITKPETVELSGWQKTANILTAPFRWIGGFFYVTFKFLFYDIWASLAGLAVAQESVEELLADLDHPDPERRRAAAERCGELGDQTAIPRLIGLLDDPVPDVRRAALVSLGHLGPADRSRIAVRSALTDPEAGVRAAAALALGRIGEPADVDRLVRALSVAENQQWFFTSSALTALAKLGGPKSFQVINEYLNQPEDSVEPVVLASAAHAIGELGASESAPRLVTLVHSQSPVVRSAAATALGELGQVDRLLEISKTGESGVLRPVLLAIGRYGSPAHSTETLALTHHPDPQVQAAALQATGDLGDPRALDQAVLFLSGTSTYLRFYASNLLTEWTGEDFGPSAELWQEWLAENRSRFEFK